MDDDTICYYNAYTTITSYRTLLVKPDATEVAQSSRKRDRSDDEEEATCSKKK
jgi:hypothetical protein